MLQWHYLSYLHSEVKNESIALMENFVAYQIIIYC